MANFGSETPSRSWKPAQSWYVVKTEPRKEPLAAKCLNELDIETFLPQFPSKTPSPFFHALFPTYLFIHCEIAGLMPQIKRAYGCYYVVSFGGKPTVVQDEIIEEIRELYTCVAGNPMEPHGFQPGDKVRVRSGPFKDWPGIFDSRLSGKDRVKILLNTIWSENTTWFQETHGLHMSVEIGMSELQRV